MVRHNGEYKVELRKEMRGGKGTVKVEHFWAAGSEMRAHNRMFARLTLGPGCSIGFHPHDAEEETFVIVSGKAEADDNGEVVQLNPGDTMLTGNGDGHAIRNIGDDDLVVVAVVSTYDR